MISITTYQKIVCIISVISVFIIYDCFFIIIIVFTHYFDMHYFIHFCPLFPLFTLESTIDSAGLNLYLSHHSKTYSLRGVFTFQTNFFNNRPRDLIIWYFM